MSNTTEKEIHWLFRPWCYKKRYGIKATEENIRKDIENTFPTPGLIGKSSPTVLMTVSGLILSTAGLVFGIKKDSSILKNISLAILACGIGAGALGLYNKVDLGNFERFPVSSLPSESNEVAKLQNELQKKLEEKIDEVKEKYRAWVEQADPKNPKTEEKMDLEKALQRMEKLKELPASNTFKKHPKLYCGYIENLLEHVLNNDVQVINYMLTCAQIPEEKCFDYLCEDKKSKLRDLPQEKLEQYIPTFWNLSRDPKDYFYIPGTTTIAYGRFNESGIIKVVKELANKTITPKDGFKPEEIELIKKALRLCSNPKYKDVISSVKSFNYISCIDNAGGLAGLKGMPIIALDGDLSDLAKRHFHEAYHQYLDNQDRAKQMQEYFKEKKLDYPTITHRWVAVSKTKEDSIKTLLDELDTYVETGSFMLDNIEEKSFSPDENKNVLNNLLEEIEHANSGIKFLKDNEKLFDDNIKSWTKDLATKWKVLKERAEKYRGQI